MMATGHTAKSKSSTTVGESPSASKSSPASSSKTSSNSSSSSASRSGSTKSSRSRDTLGWDGFGGYMAAKKQKIDSQINIDDGFKSKIFDGVAIYINGYTKPSSDELRCLIRQHGGRYEQYLMKTIVTHIIATSLPDSKIRSLRDFKVVRPEWITDSIKAGRLLSHAPYKLFTNQTNSLATFSSVLTRSTCANSNSAVLSDAAENGQAQGSPEGAVSNTQKVGNLRHSKENGSGSDFEKSWSGGCSANTSNSNIEELDKKAKGKPGRQDNGKLWDNEDEGRDKGQKPEQLVGDADIEENFIVERSNTKGSGSFCDFHYAQKDTSVRSSRLSKNRSSPSVNKPLALAFASLSASSPALTVSSTANSSAKDFSSTANSCGQVSTSTARARCQVSSSTAKSPAKVASSKVNSPTKAGDPKFLSEFYSHSRLHHLSTWGSEFRAYVSKLQKESSGSYPGRDRLRLQHVQRMSERGFGRLTSAKLEKPQRIIMHVDMDCFFVSVGLLSHPELKGKPVAVTHSRGKGMSEQAVPGSNFAFEKADWQRKREAPGSGKKGRRKPVAVRTGIVQDEEEERELQDDEIAALDEPLEQKDFKVSATAASRESFHSLAEIASCSYEARLAGVKNGMFMGQAKLLCPDLVTIPYDFEGYNKVSTILYDTVASFTHDIEAVSCDEMLVDCTDVLADTGATSEEFADLLRKDIFNKTKCPASAGIGSNILLARLATRRAKPNNQYHLQQADVPNFIKEQLVGDLPGVGWSMSKKLSSMGVVTCGDLQKHSLASLQHEFGPKTGQSLYRFCRGEDDRPIRTEKERKSVSAEINYGIRFQNETEAAKFVEELGAEVGDRLQAVGMKARTLTLKLMVRRPDAPTETAKFMGHGICNNVSKSVALPLATDDGGMLGKEAVTLLKAMKVNASDLRGVGIQTHRLESSAPKIASASAAVKGNQTILSFAVPRSSEETAAQKKNDSSAAAEQSRDGVVKSPPRPPRVHSPGSEQTPPLPSLPSLNSVRKSTSNTSSSGSTSSCPDSEGVGRSHKNCMSGDFFLSPSQVDKEVLKELPPDIRRQIEREMRHSQQSLAPSHTQGRQSRKRQRDGPGCSHWATPSDDSSSDSSSQGKRSGESAQSESASDHLNLSYSQIDLDVLHELPDDIQEQIQREMLTTRTRRSASKLSTISKESAASLQSPSEIGASGPATKLPTMPKGEKGDDAGGTGLAALPQQLARNKSNENNHCLPDLSQLDPSCLDALPEELQNEIHAAYTRQEVTKRSHLSSPHKVQPGGRGRGRGRGRGQSRGRGQGQRSPMFKVPRGRPVSSRKKDFEPRKLDFLRSDSSNRQGKKLDTAVEVAVLSVDVRPSAGVTPSANALAIQDVGVNLCGAVSLQEVRALLSEWLDSTKDPQQQDIEVMVAYLGQLVLDRNLEQVDLVLKFLYRKIVEHQRLTWKESLSSIVTHTQDLVKSVYGSTLKTDWVV